MAGGLRFVSGTRRITLSYFLFRIMSRKPNVFGYRPMNRAPTKAYTVGARFIGRLENYSTMPLRTFPAEVENVFWNIRENADSDL